MPRVSVIIPVYNRTHELVRALKSLQNQSFKDFETIVVDDHSTQDIQTHLTEFKTKYLKTVGKGVSAARNTGTRSSSAEFVAFLDSDDEWLPTKLEKQIDYFDSNPDCEILHTNEIWLRGNKVVKQNLQQKKQGGRIFSHCVNQCLIAASSVLIKKTLHERVGLFDESFPVCEDFDLWLRISAAHDIGFLSEDLVVKHGGHADQLSRLYHSMDLWRVRALMKHIENKDLSPTEQKVLRSSLKHKCEILMKGFEKHQNFENQSEIDRYLALA